MRAYETIQANHELQNELGGFTMKFEDFKLDSRLLDGISDAGYTECLPVQEVTLKDSLQGRDVCVQSQTGSGKTAAFLLTIYQKLLTDPSLKEKKALIISPTRELAVQIGREADILGRHTGINNCVVYGGSSYDPQERAISEGARIIVATPGRLLDFINQRKIDLKQYSICVIDEADRLFDMGFLPDIRRILKKLPPANKRQTMLFSATLGYRARELSWEHMNETVEIEMSPETVTVDSVTQELYHVSSEDKFGLLLGILKQENPKAAIIFTNTKDEAVRVTERLEENGFPSEYIIGDLPQKKRSRLIENLKKGHLKFLVATNVASRGLHVADLPLVINYDLPEDPEDYVHRIGRTARVGKEGKAIAIACDRFVHSLEAIEELIGMKIPVIWPDDDLIVRDYILPSRSARYRGSKTGHGRTGQKPGRPAKNESRRPVPREKSAPRTKKGSPREEPSRKQPAQRKKESAPVRSEPALSGQNIEDRLEYYKRKYGESFKVKES
jgi:ATP-dependent RNA helicase RhlB